MCFVPTMLTGEVELVLALLSGQPVAWWVPATLVFGNPVLQR